MFQKGWRVSSMEKSMREGKRFAKHRSTIMIEGQRDSGAKTGRQRRRDSMTQEERAEEEKVEELR